MGYATSWWTIQISPSHAVPIPEAFLCPGTRGTHTQRERHTHTGRHRHRLGLGLAWQRRPSLDRSDTCRSARLPRPSLDGPASSCRQLEQKRAVCMSVQPSRPRTPPSRLVAVGVVSWAVCSWLGQPGVLVPGLSGSSSHRRALALRNAVPALPPTDEWHDVSFQFSGRSTRPIAHGADASPGSLEGWLVGGRAG